MSPKQQKALEQVVGAVNCINFELSKEEDELVANRSLLQSFLDQLEKITKEIENGDLPPKVARQGGMGRVIVDSWPLTHPLGEKIISAEHAYLRLELTD